MCGRKMFRFSDDQIVKLGIVKGNNSNKGNCGKGSDPGLEEGVHNDDSPYENTENCWAGKKQASRRKKANEEKCMSLCCGGDRDSFCGGGGGIDSCW